MLYSAQLNLQGVQMSGSLAVGDGLRFTPSERLHAQDAELLDSIGRGEVTWGSNGTRYEQPVQVLAHPEVHQLELTPTGDCVRVQTRHAVRRPVAVSATVVLPEPDGVVLRRAQTIDVSIEGVAVLFEPEPGRVTPPRPPEAGSIGIIIDLPELRINAVAEVMSPIATGARSGVRVRFTHIHNADVDAIARFVSRVEVLGHGQADVVAERGELPRPVEVAVSIEPDRRAEFACAVLVDPLVPVQCQIIDDRTTSAWIRVLSDRRGSGVPLRARVDILPDQPILVYESGGVWLLGTIARAIADEIHLHLISPTQLDR